MSNHLIIYHGGCWDGFAAAMVAADALGAPCELHPAGYGQPAPPVEGRRVYILDFSYPPAVMHDIADRAESVVWLDHHHTAIEAMAANPVRNPGWFQVTASDASGAMLAWEHFHTPVPPPWPINYIEDRDLWRHELPNCDAVAMWIRSHEQTRVVWDQIMATPLATAERDGLAMARYHDTLVANAAAQALQVTIGGVAMPMATCSYDLGSDVCNALLAADPGRDVAAYLLLNKDGEWQYGLRSTEAFDSSALAQIFGGGGHRQAAGFKAPYLIHIREAQ